MRRVGGKTVVESVPWADRWTESYSGSEDGHPRDVENTGRNIATESRNRKYKKALINRGKIDFFHYKV